VSHAIDEAARGEARPGSGEGDRSLRVGLSLRHMLQADPAALADLVREVDHAGFNDVWAPHHTVVPTEYESRYPYQLDNKLPFPSDTIYSDSLTLLAYVAALTTRVRLGTNVIPIITQHPLVLAKQAASLDHLSGGRLDLGLGAGWLAEEGIALAQGTDRRARRLDEAIDIMRKVWVGQPVSHDGEFWHFPELVCRPTPARGSDVSIWIGGGSAAAVRTMVAQRAGAILPPGDAGADLLVKLRASLPPRWPIVSPLVVSPEADDDTILASLRAVRDAGATGVILLGPTDARELIPLVRRIGERVLPGLAK